MKNTLSMVTLSLALSGSAHAAASSSSSSLQVKTAEQKSIESKRDTLVVGTMAALAALYKLFGPSTAKTVVQEMSIGLNTKGNAVENIFKGAITTISGDNLNRLEIATEADIKELQTKLAKLQARLVTENKKSAQGNTQLVTQLQDKILKAEYDLILAEKSLAEHNKKLATEKAQKTSVQADIDQVATCDGEVKKADQKYVNFKQTNSQAEQALAKKTQEEQHEFEGFKRYVTRKAIEKAADVLDIEEFAEGGTTLLDDSTQANLEAVLAMFKVFISRAK